MPTSVCLPLAASGPVRAIEKPILIGSWACPAAGNRLIPTVASAAATAAPLNHFFELRITVSSRTWNRFAALYAVVRAEAKGCEAQLGGIGPSRLSLVSIRMQ